MTRPVIICHMISSVDGRIVTERWTSPVDGRDRDAIINQYFDIEKNYDADGWIIGRTTASEHFVKAAEPRKGSTDRFPRKAYVAHTSAKRLAIIMDPRGRLQYEQPDIEGDHIVAVLAETVADEYLQSLQDHGISYCFAGPDGHDISKAVDVLGNTFGRRKVLLEGGGRINGAFLKAGVIDELSLLIYPGIDGLSRVASSFDWMGASHEQPASGQALRLKYVEKRQDDVIWLQYRIERSGP
ncbi:MAG: dihydrofolate reductase family protein [Acetobacter sp.]|jgi:5-amino-6-(5-phosphoribosylamino)uracil reductase|nr:dihydrofolate reductase family protein [Acetobacter sp.]MCH4061027.1 dihydrofolate reductase family protein [Acetobacter sp.]MCH4087966.1 dihydrofolate reductase family protein [Acetobacter sp.]MCI1293421.1 dihydrofolate reductase family protein [Acetobacter sp.]MCI1319954.1 dihydrofolate reductase family protein [Acetobacter sp.]